MSGHTADSVAHFDVAGPDLEALAACHEEVVARPAGELAAASGPAAASDSERLKVLRETGLLVLESRGRFRPYRTDVAVVREVGEAVGALLGRGC
jgi:DNA-binding transcriptional ArsR family regulator